MALGTGFSNTGATPTQSSNGVFNSGTPTTPYGKALANPSLATNINPGTNSIPSPTNSTNQSAGTSQMGNYSGLLNAPSTALKSTTITQPNGTIIKQEHHTPNDGGNNSTPDTEGTTYAGLVAKALEAGKNAGGYNAETKKEESDVENNPNYTGGLGLGLSGQIERNRGAQGAELLSEAQTAASLAATAKGTPTAFGQGVFNPSTNTIEGGNNTTNLNPINNIDSIADQVISGQISPSQAYSLGGSVPNFEGALNQAIIAKNPKADLATLQGSYDAKQQNTTTSGTAPTNAAADLYKSTYPQLQQLKTTTNNIGQFGNLLLSHMVAPDGTNINPSNVKYANQTIGQIRSQLSSSQQAQFDTTFAQLKAQIASLLSTGGAQIPTQTTQDANAIIDGSAPLGTLNATLQRIATEGNILTSNLETQLNTAGKTIGAPKVGNNNNPAGI